MAVIGGELRAVVFGELEVRLLTLPARAPTLDHHRAIGRGNVQLWDPTIGRAALAPAAPFPDLKGRHTHPAFLGPGHPGYEGIRIGPRSRTAAFGPLPGLTLRGSLGGGYCCPQGGRRALKSGHFS